MPICKGFVPVEKNEKKSKPEENVEVIKKKSFRDNGRKTQNITRES